MKDALRHWLRRRLWWIQFQELNHEGWRCALRRRRIHRVILSTPPVYTDRAGDTEVRVLTWRRDWINVIWALKSFYYFSDTRFPLYIHDGGLLDEHARGLLAHFPNAVFVSRQVADVEVERKLEERGYQRSLAYRRRNFTTLKLFDFFLTSKAKTVLSIDSDIVFFQCPAELLDKSAAPNLYNKDESYQYSISLDKIERRFGIRPIPFINSGLSRIARESIDFRSIEQWLQDEELFRDEWVTEQTLHALCSARWGAELLPETYLVSTQPGLGSDLVCKHYPGNDRRLLYEEGMRHLIEAGFCNDVGVLSEKAAVTGEQR